MTLPPSTLSRKPRLLILTSTFPRWPNDHDPPFVYELARRLTTDFEIDVLAPHAAGARLHETMDGLHVWRFRYAPEHLERLAYDGGIPARLRRSPIYTLLLPAFVQAQLWAAWRLLRRRHHTIIHAHWLIPQGLLAVLLKGLARPRPRLLLTAHGADIFAFNGRASRWLKERALAKADAVSMVSEALRARALPLTHHPERLHVAPMGVDLTELFVPPVRPTTKPVLVFVGRMVEKKGFADLLAAMPRVLDRCPEVELIAAGDGPLATELRAQAGRLSIERSVTFRGSLTNADIAKVFRHSSLAVLPFRPAAGGDQEGLGLVAVEAMGCGLPVIAGDVPAIHDVIRHGHNGWLAPPSNPSALAEAILHLLDNPALAQRLGRQGRIDALQRFDWSAVAARYRGLLNDESPGGRGPTPP